MPPYISPFITLAKAIDWISKQDKCNRREATRRIIPVLADMTANSIPGWRWEDQRSGMFAVLDSRPDYPDLDRQYWQGKSPIRRGKVFDRWTKQWRTLLIPRQIIFQFWPETSAASAGSESRKTKGRGTLLLPKQSALQFWLEPYIASAGSENGKSGPITKAKRRYHRRDENEIHRALDQLFQQGPNLKDLYQKERAALVSKECGKRYDKRTVEKYFQSWLEKHRTDA